jgi:hypothetical protein
MVASLVICIPAFNESACLPSLISLLAASSAWQLAQRRHVLVALNGCTDDSLARLGQISLKGAALEILELSQASKNAAWNALVDRARGLGPELVFVDADVRPHPQAIEQLLSRLDRDPGVDLVAALPRPTTAFLARPSWYQQARVRFADSSWVSRGSGERLYPRGNLYAIRSRRAAKIRLPVREPIGDDLFLGQLLGAKAIIETNSLVYFSPPSFSDHLRQRARQRRGLEALKRDFPELRPRPQPPSGPPSLGSLAEFVYFLMVATVEWRARRMAPEARWRQIRSARAIGGPRSEGFRFRLYRQIQTTMLWLGRFRVWRQLLGWMYQWVAWLTARVLVALPGVRAFRVSGSLDNQRMTPGLSDIDGEIILAELPPEQEAQAVATVVRVYGRLRYLLPILQEPFMQRASDDRCAQRCAEPWTVTAHYRVLAGNDGRHGLTPGATGEAFASLFLRRYLRFYTRQALSGAGRESLGFVRLHQRGLASANAVLRGAAGGTLVPGTFEEEMAMPASAGMEQIFSWYRKLQNHGFQARAWPDPDQLGAQLAAVGCLIATELALALPTADPLSDQPIACEGAEFGGLDRYLDQQLEPLRRGLRSSPLLSGLPCLVSRCGPQNWQHRFYLLLPPGAKQSMVEDCFRELQSVWRGGGQEAFPASHFGTFPNPCLLPTEALAHLDLCYGAAWEKLLLKARYPERAPCLPTSPARTRQMVLRNLAEQAVPLLRRLDLATASARTRLRFLDVFFGLLPAAAVFAKSGKASLSVAVACQNYQREFDDPYCEFLGCLPAASLWFEGPLLEPARLARLHRQWYPVLRTALDRHWQSPST